MGEGKMYIFCRNSFYNISGVMVHSEEAKYSSSLAER